MSGTSPSWIAATIWFAIVAVLALLGIWMWDKTAGLHWLARIMLSLVAVFLITASSYKGIAKEYAAEHVPKLKNDSTPPQRAVVSLFGIETAYAIKAPRGGIAKVSLMIGRPVDLQAYFINDGSVLAEKANGYGKVFLAPDKSDATELSLAKRFDDYIATRHIPETGSTIEPHARTEHTITALSDTIITKEDVTNLTKDAAHVNEFMYLFLAETYVDEAGPHTLRYCKRLEPPAFSPEMWVFCNKIQDRQEDTRLKGAVP
jgi:hypothetical protein